MTTGLQLALLAGGLVGGGIALLLWRLMPADPDLRDALTRLSTVPAPPATSVGGSGGGPGGRFDRVGRWGWRTLPAGLWRTTPAADLAVLRIPPAQFAGDKLVSALLGLAAPPLLVGLLTLLGTPLPVPVPIAASLACAVGLFWLPDHQVRAQAKRARAEFARTIGAYLDLVALERAAGSGPRQAMEVAADIGDDWVFRRIGEELARSRWSGQPPWDALHHLADQLALPELDELADIMRLSGEEGAQVYTTLRARSAGIRSALLHDDLAAANAAGEKLAIPISLLGVIFLALLITPALLRLTGGP